MEWHYILVIMVIVAIIGFQIYIYLNTKKKIDAFKSIFPQSTSSYSIIEIEVPTNEEYEDNKNAEYDDEEDEYDEDEYEDFVNVSQIKVTAKNPTLNEICNALNMYLQKNKGAASDFHLMKDVVERYCDAEEEEISVQQPIPLYLGLMGTMVGIIVGIGFIAVSGGLSSTSLMDNITSLMTCVAIAMAASLVGIFCTTLISWNSKSATTKVETDKNRFYSWLQTELLPVLSGNAVNALYLLQQNLTTFNQTFQSNISGLDKALAKVVESSKEQTELISLIKDIDIKRVAQANITVLKELKECTGEIEVFNRYLHNVSEYLTAVNELNGNINEHLNRTHAIEQMGEFFEREINQVQAREQYINQVVANVDNVLRRTVESLEESTRERITTLRNNSVSEFDALLQHYAQQKTEFERQLQEQREEFAARSEETITLMKEIKNLAEVKSVMSQVLEATKNQTAAIERLANSLKNQPNGSYTQTAVEPTSFNPKIELPRSIVYMVAVITISAVASLGIYIYTTFVEKPKVTTITNKPISKQASIVVGTDSTSL
jgi:biopolymer transport protein ExbB/TolQ